MRVRVSPSVPRGTIVVPPSKSIAHRAVICACLAQGGRSTLRHVGNSQDIRATACAMQAFGAELRETRKGLSVKGGLAAGVPLVIDCGESGSTLRFLIPIACLLGQRVTFTGRGRLLERPQNVYEELFAERGIAFTHSPERIEVCGRLEAGRFRLRGDVSSQFITGLLFALPLLKGDSVVEVLPPFESRSYVELTLDVLRSFGVSAKFTDEYTLAVPGGQSYRPCDYTVEGDYSQAAFYAVLGSVCGGIICGGLREDSTQGDRVIMDIVRSFGADLMRGNCGCCFQSGRLAAQEVDLADCPDLGPALMVLAAFSDGKTVIRNAGRLRLKESDRIAAMEEELRKLGVGIRSDTDTVTIFDRSVLERETVVSAHNDHRIAMSLAVFAACSDAPVVIEGAECVAKSYPDFWEDFKSVGVRVRKLDR